MVCFIVAMPVSPQPHAQGWYAIRHEHKRLMAIFLIIAFVIISGWAIMFYSLVYRWTFVQWPLLACYTIEAYIVLIGSIVLGIICWLNFGKGLAHYRQFISPPRALALTGNFKVHAEDRLASLDFKPETFSHDVEKGVYEDGTKVSPTFIVPTLHKLPSESDPKYRASDYKRSVSIDSEDRYCP